MGDEIMVGGYSNDVNKQPINRAVSQTELELAEQLSAANAEIERLREAFRKDREWFESRTIQPGHHNKIVLELRSKLEAHNAFVAAFDRNWVQGVFAVSIRNANEITEARAALEE